MKRTMLIAAVAAVLCLYSDARAASLYGKVIDVSSGDVITIFNLNRPVRVKLLGVDAPELNQAFGDLAREHLSALIHDKSVLVEYSGIAADGSVAGRVLLNDTDICAQMIRDGAAWLDPNNVNRLSATDREIYQASEQAARNERRGLWQDENPVAPWEFVKKESLKKNRFASLNSTVPASRKRNDEPLPELTNLTLLMTGMNARYRREPTREEIEAEWRALTATPKDWFELRPAGQNFSVMVPEGRQITYPVPFGDDPVEVNMYIARDGAGVYTVLWVTGPTYGETDRTALEAMIVNTYIKASHKNYERSDRGHFYCGERREKNISTNGYTGIEFDLSSCLLPTRARGFTRVVGNQRDLYMAVVFYGDDDENVARFVKTFNITGQKTKAPTR